VVEDDPRTADMLRRGLAEDGHLVDVTADGEEALWRATEIDYDVVVLDLMLPGADGLDLCRRLRAAGRWSAVLILSARNGIEDRVQCLDAGADDFVPKPFAFAELNARLRAIARRGTPERPSVLVAGDLTLDPAARRVWRGDTEISLSAKEFALLELFLRRCDKVLGRTAIREHLWDFAAEATSNVIDQYVAALRRKIDRPFGVRQLETVRGVGYCLRSVPTPAPADVLEPLD
jgi:two-component system OmpR family response regulator